MSITHVAVPQISYCRQLSVTNKICSGYQPCQLVKIANVSGL